MTEIVVTAPARLHFGMLDPAGMGTRRYGGVGVGIGRPRVAVAVAPSATPGVEVDGEQSERAAEVARRVWSQLGLRDGARLTVREAIPPHMGLGSGTKLGLAIARALGELAGLDLDPAALARLSGRGARSSVGSWTFALPGLVVEAGVRDEGSISPLIARHPMPERWRCVLALPLRAQGLAGAAEERFFAGLSEPAGAEPSVARLLLTALLPGLITGDIEEFGVALTEMQRAVGSIFAAEQGGVYHAQAAPLIAALLQLGVGAVGQSSWGPATYGIVESPERAAEVARELRAIAGAAARVEIVDFDRRGALVERRAEASLP
ncbi:MAG: hypothetical protein JOZ07_01635 [Solirubrobacterales bacterium]|nr:hypothetical protein [Solirubrobacterales bacterium]